MSAPLRLLPGGADGSVESADPLPTLPRPRRRPKWAAPDPLDELAERLAQVCAGAVHPYEIAAVLESDGISDEQITGVYGRRDLFAIAEELYARVPRRYPQPPPADDPWRADVVRCLLRGLVFALPGVAYVLAGHLLSGPPDGYGLPSATVALAAAALTGWAWNQALAHRAYLWLAAEGRRGAARCLLAGAPPGAALACGAALALPGGAGTAAFVAGQAVYLAAATALLVLGSERDLLAALAPAVADAIVLPLAHAPQWARTAALLTSLTLAVAASARRLTTAARIPAESCARPRSPLHSVPFGLFGLAGGALTLLAVFGDVLGRAPGASVHGPLAVALTLSMGPAEWSLYRYRSRALAAQRSTSTPGAFRRRAALVLLGCLGGYLAVLAALLLAAALLWPPAAPRDVASALALPALGAVLWLALLLQAFGVAWWPASLCCFAACAELALTVSRSAPPDAVRAVTGWCTAGVLALFACALLGRVTAHR
ncbi:hypothetical protein [Streptomyces sp. ICBB 8177]|uniref:hypothetical protein n=1 Tax=Streptomyces sp. ICBB 8177 TaxID=563922 RepID=UPI000D673289|nr:hypothetical protein [Streptomyces sp. ICBB 8177]PWI44431.1 hypothetical protein CK485_10945 [Streptomyces sp. ICBB 8177]